MSIDAKRQALFSAAVRFAAAQQDGEAQRALCKAAAEYQDARMASAGGVTAAVKAAPAQGQGDAVVPFGKDKGRPLASVSKRSLEWLIGCLEHSIADESKARWVDSNTSLRDAVAAELARRP